MIQQLTFDERLDAVEADLATDDQRLARLERICDLEKCLDAILAELRRCDDPAREDALQIELVRRLDEHQEVMNESIAN